MTSLDLMRLEFYFNSFSFAVASSLAPHNQHCGRIWGSSPQGCWLKISEEFYIFAFIVKYKGNWFESTQYSKGDNNI